MYTECRNIVVSVGVILLQELGRHPLSSTYKHNNNNNNINNNKKRPKAPFFFFFFPFSQRFYYEEKQGFHSRGYDDALVLILLLCASFQRCNRIPSLYIHMYVLSLFTPPSPNNNENDNNPPLSLFPVNTHKEKERKCLSISDSIPVTQHNRTKCILPYDSKPTHTHILLSKYIHIYSSLYLKAEAPPPCFQYSSCHISAPPKKKTKKKELFFLLIKEGKAFFGGFKKKKKNGCARKNICSHIKGRNRHIFELKCWGKKKGVKKKKRTNKQAYFFFSFFFSYTLTGVPLRLLSLTTTATRGTKTNNNKKKRE